MTPHSLNALLSVLLVAGTFAAPAGLLAQQRELPPKRPIPAGEAGRPAADLPEGRDRPVADLGAFTPLVVRGSGGPTEERAGDDVGEPPDLTSEQQSQMVSALGLSLWHGNGPWKVTPATPVAAGRAYLGFREAELVGVGSGSYPASARIHGRSPYGSSGYVSLTVRADAAGERYLIDCKVSPQLRGLRFSGPGGAATFTSDHLTAIYEAEDTEPAGFRIEVPLIETSSSWTFYSCEVTPLQ